MQSLTKSIIAKEAFELEPQLINYKLGEWAYSRYSGPARQADGQETKGKL